MSPIETLATIIAILAGTVTLIVTVRKEGHHIVGAWVWLRSKTPEIDLSRRAVLIGGSIGFAGVAGYLSYPKLIEILRKKNSIGVGFVANSNNGIVHVLGPYVPKRHSICFRKYVPPRHAA